MAFDINSFVQTKTSKGKTGFSVDKFLTSKGFVKPDLTSSEGLYQTALNTGNKSLIDAAGNIIQPEQTLWGRVKSGSKKLLGKTLDVLQRGNYAVASAVKNEIDKDPNTDWLSGLQSGITGRTKHTFDDVFTEAGWNPDTRLGKIAKGSTAFAADILLDPTTYLTFGYGAGEKVGAKVLSKAGMEFAAKAGAKKVGTAFGEQFLKDTIVKMAEKSPELYGKFLDKGGIKYFGTTLVSSGRIAGVLEKIPGVSKVADLTEGTRNTLYALFNRDASAKFGKLPDEYIKLQQTYRDLGAVKSADAIEQAMQIAQANKLNIEEAKIITNAIENNTHLADTRLENARRLFEHVLGKNLKEELKRGIGVGELPNYVPHILVDTDVSKAIPFKPEGVRATLGAQKGRTIGKVVEDSEPFMAKVEDLRVHPDDLPEDLARIEEYKAKIAAGEKIDPLRLIRESDGKMAVEDGKHRLEAFKQSGHTEVPAFEQITKIKKGEDVARATIEEINSAFGKEFFDPNVVNAVANRSMASARATTANDFLRDVAAKFGEIPEKAPSGYVAAGAKELKGFVFHPAIAEQIDKFKGGLINDEATNNLLKAFDKVQNLWKASVTSIFPAFHGRNAISNVFLNFLDIGASALNPAKHATAIELLNLNRQATNLKRASLGVGEKAVKAKGELQALLEKQVLNDGHKQWTFGELRKAIKENRVAFSNEYSGFLDIPDTVERKLNRAKNVTSKAKQVGTAVNPFSQDNLAFRAGRKTGQVIEEQARIVNFISNLQKTGDVATSAARTKQFLFDYQNLSKFEKDVMRRVIPFYTFTRKNIELQVTQMLKQPGKFATQAKLFTQLSKSISGGTLTDDEKKSLPEWLQSGLGLVTKRDGQDVEIINSLGTPVESLFGSIQPNAILGSVSPIAAVPLQIAIGKHFFFNKDLKDVNDASAFKKAPQFVKDYIGYSERKNKDGSIRAIALNPTRLFIIQNIPPSSRVVSVIGQLEDENVSGKLKLMRQLTGLKPYGKNLDDEATYREKEKIRALQDLLDKSGVAPIFKRSFIPKATNPRTAREQAQ